MAFMPANTLLPPGTRGAQFARFRKPDGSYFNAPYDLEVAQTVKKLAEGEVVETDLNPKALQLLEFVGVPLEKADGYVSVEPGYTHIGDIMPR